MATDPLAAKRDSLIKQITDVFQNVSREGGASWGEAAIAFRHGPDHERAAARALDTDQEWTQLLRADALDPSRGMLVFLDAIGFRYYVAPAMIVCVHGNQQLNLQNCLFLPGGKNQERRHLLQQWSLLNPAQLLGVGAFLKYMDAAEQQEWEERDLDMEDPTEWQEAYESYWKDACKSAPKKASTKKGS